MTTKTQYLGNLRTEIEHLQSGTKIITDAPLDNRGKGESFSPTDIFASSLCSCMLTIMGISAQTHGFSIDGATAETDKVMSASPRRVAEINITIRMPHNNYSEKEKKIIDMAIKQCPVGLSLHPETRQNIKIVY